MVIYSSNASFSMLCQCLGPNRSFDRFNSFVVLWSNFPPKLFTLGTGSNCNTTITRVATGESGNCTISSLCSLNLKYFLNFLLSCFIGNCVPCVLVSSIIWALHPRAPFLPGWHLRLEEGLAVCRRLLLLLLSFMYLSELKDLYY